jgi:cytochrome c oxidase cbb3-type subunit 3
VKNQGDNKKKIKSVEQKDTGHEWDGIKEYDNPDPLWLRYTFYAAVFFALIYWVLYPSWPTPNNMNVLGWSSSKEVEAKLKEIEKIRLIYQEEFSKASFEEIQKNHTLMKFALAGGQSTFLNNCAVCHGAGGGGNQGYPNLTAGAWLWGGKIDDIYTTIKQGIRSEHPDTRDSIMAAFGKDGILKSDQIEKLVDYVLSLKDGADINSEAHQIFQSNCASCHGDKGQGGRDFGAPALNDAVWLYGNSKDTIYDVIYNGRGGVMPYWEGKLSDSSIRQVAIYIHQLGGGE